MGERDEKKKKNIKCMGKEKQNKTKNNNHNNNRTCVLKKKRKRHNQIDLARPTALLPKS